MTIYSSSRSNYGLAGVIEALLLVALVALILSTIQLVYVPDIMEKKEAEHMEEVSNQISSLKSVVEIQSMMGVTDSDKPIAYSPISSPITLGSDKLPYFVTGWSLGKVDIFDVDRADTEKIVVFPPPNDIPDEYVSGIPLTYIKYISENTEFVDQTYLLQGGAIILNQSTGEVMKVPPSITVDNQTNTIKFNYFVPVFKSKPGKNSSNLALDTVFIRTNYSDHYTSTLGIDVDIYIYSAHLDSWYNSLVEDSDGLLWEYIDNGYVDVNIGGTPRKITISGNSKRLDTVLTIVELEAQIGPGFVN